jgi:hypothetical protein
MPVIHHDAFRNNADLGKGVPRQHVFMKPVNSSFFEPIREKPKFAVSLSPPPIKSMN